MREYTVKGKQHKVYEADEVPIDISPISDWTQAEIGDWVVADDGGVIQQCNRNLYRQLYFLKRYYY